MARDLDVNKPLRSLDFSHLIGSPLLACISAQESAARCSEQYIEEVGLQEDEDGRKEAIMISFSFVQEGKAVVLRVPLLSIVPIPYFSIDVLDINFRANVKISDGQITASYAPGSESKNVNQSLYNVENSVDVHVRASQDDMPAGLSKVLGVLGNSIRSYSEQVTLPEESDDQLVRLLCKVTKTSAIFTQKEDGTEVVDTVLTKIPEVELMKVRELFIDYEQYPFKSLEVLSLLTHLTNLTLTFDSSKVNKLDLSAVPQLRRLKLTDLNKNYYDGIFFDFSPLTSLRILRLKNITNYSGGFLSLKSIPTLERLNLTETVIGDLDISRCPEMEMLSINKSRIGRLIVSPSFNQNSIFGDNVGEIVTDQSS